MTSLFHDPCNMMSWLSFYGNVTGMYSIAGNTKKKLNKMPMVLYIAYVSLKFWPL